MSIVAKHIGTDKLKAGSNYRLKSLTLIPADPLLKFLDAFKADDRIDKIDLGVGVYRNDLGRTPVMETVKLAEREPLNTQSSKACPSSYIINQPQSAILGVGKLEKRVVVQSISGQDVIAIKPMAFVSLTIDHRVLGGNQRGATGSTGAVVRTRYAKIGRIQELHSFRSVPA